MARDEVTGRKTPKSKKKSSKRRPPMTTAQLPMPAADARVLTRNEFCARNRISLPFYSKLRAQGLGPREIRLASKILITAEADAAWRAEREAASQVAAE